MVFWTPWGGSDEEDRVSDLLSLRFDSILTSCFVFSSTRDCERKQERGQSDFRRFSAFRKVVETKLTLASDTSS